MVGAERYAEVGGFGEVVVAGCWFMLMAIEKYEVVRSGIRFWYSLLEFASGGSGRS
jgi:hypothetical protein